MQFEKKPSWRRIALLVVIATLAACQGVQRTQSTDRMEIVMTDEGCAPLDARVEADSTLTLKIENRSGASQTVRLLIYPLTIASNPFHADNVYWQTSVQPGFSVIEELPTPKMPGDYDLICGEADVPDRSQGELTVIRP